MVRECCPGSRTARQRSQSESSGNDDDAIPSLNAISGARPTGPRGHVEDSSQPAPESVQRKVLRGSRPLVLTIAAALAFAGLLRFHHAKFEDSMIRSFQRQQLDTTRGLAVSVEESIVNIRRALTSLASHPDVCRLAPSMQEVLLPYLQQEQAILDDLEVIDTHNRVLWPKPPVVHGKTIPLAGTRSPVSPSPDISTPTGGGAERDRAELAEVVADYGQKSSFYVISPIKVDGRQVASLRATVSMYRVALNCRLRAANAYGDVCWMFTDTGQVVYSNAMPRERQVVHLLRNADSIKEPVANVDLLAYVTDRLFGKSLVGNSGLLEVARPGEPVDELAAYARIRMEGRQFGVLLAAPKGEVSVPIASHERVTYALIGALALLYFATGYTAYRSERAHNQLAEQRLCRVREGVTGTDGSPPAASRLNGPGGTGTGNSEPESTDADARVSPEPCWDRSEATRLTGGNAQTVDLIIKLFVAELDRVLPQAEHAALTQDADALAAIAHQWRGSLGVLGARRAQACATRLEEMCRLGEPERLSETFAVLRRELLLLERSLSSTKENDLCKS
jgi:HPt (histidine-containing phosphotransfer) domain-containing protein